MIVERLKIKFRASASTLEEMVENVDISDMESKIQLSTTMELLDENDPEVNGVKLLKHPYRSAEFQSTKDGGGRMAIIKVNDVSTTIITRTRSGNIGKNLDDFASQLKDYQNKQLVGKIGEVIKGNFFSYRGQPGRPKSMTPEDFWAQLTEQELEVVSNSSDVDVLDLIKYINSLKKVNLSTKKVQTGITYLFVNKLIQSKTYRRFVD